MDKGDVVIPQHQYVSHNASIYLLCAPVVLEVLVICDDVNLVLCTHEEVSPVFQALHDCKEFAVPDGVVAFSFIECF